LNKIDLEKLTSLQDVRARTQVQAVIYDLIGAANVPLSGGEKERICREVLHEVFGLGPLEPLLQDASLQTFSSTRIGRFISSGAACLNLPALFLKTLRTFGTLSTKSSPTWDGALMSRRPCATRAWMTAPA